MSELSEAVERLALARKSVEEESAALAEIDAAIEEQYGATRRKQFQHLRAANHEKVKARDWVESWARKAHYSHFIADGRSKPHPATAVLATRPNLTVTIARDLSEWLPGEKANDA